MRRVEGLWTLQCWQLWRMGRLRRVQGRLRSVFVNWRAGPRRFITPCHSSATALPTLRRRTSQATLDLINEQQQQQWRRPQYQHCLLYSLVISTCKRRRLGFWKSCIGYIFICQESVLESWSGAAWARADTAYQHFLGRLESTATFSWNSALWSGLWKPSSYLGPGRETGYWCGPQEYARFKCKC